MSKRIFGKRKDFARLTLTRAQMDERKIEEETAPSWREQSLEKKESTHISFEQLKEQIFDERFNLKSQRNTFPSDSS